ncbi:MAG TPA: glycosyl transferase, partial [Chloroflexota bacterium]|nr:glycosyl transferase [Chloroflexota bacterium]
LVKGRHVAQGGKDHTSHRLVKLGLPHRQAVLVLYGASVIAGMIAVTMSQGGQTMGMLLVLPTALAVLTAGLLLGRVET